MGRFARVAEQVADATDADLSMQISVLTRSEVERLLPDKQDKQAFLQLVHAVESKHSDDEKLRYLRENMQTAGRVVIKLLGELVWLRATLIRDAKGGLTIDVGPPLFVLVLPPSAA